MASKITVAPLSVMHIRGVFDYMNLVGGAVKLMSAIYDPEMPEPLNIHPWHASKAREVRDAILGVTLDVAASGELWPAHPDGDAGDLGFNLPTSVYVGAAGVVASLAALGGKKTQLADLAMRAVRAHQALRDRGELDKGYTCLVRLAGPWLHRFLRKSQVSLS